LNQGGSAQAASFDAFAQPLSCALRGAALSSIRTLIAVLHATLVCNHFETSAEATFFAAAEAEENTQTHIVNEAVRNAMQHAAD